VAPPPVGAEPPQPAPVIYEPPPVIVDDSIYTAADLNVAGPSLQPRQLPWQWPRDVRRSDTLEVLISPDGDVERIKLLSVPRRMTDAMSLSAAKAWKFAPATKDGAPVRYRLFLTPGGATY
jgi:outer membrane biosynthesis protein TonB